MGFRLKLPKIKTGIKFIDKNATRGVNNFANMWGQKGPYKEPSPGPPGEDPKVTELRNKLYGEANQFREDMPGLMKEQENLLATDADRAAGQGVRSARSDFNNRGLLYSGMRQGAEGDVKARVASQLASSTAGVRQNYENTARAKENVAAQVGLQGYQEALRRADETFSLQMEKNVQARQQMQQLGQAGGYAAGTYAAGGFNQPAQAQAATAQSPYGYYNSDQGFYGGRDYTVGGGYYGQGLMA